MESQMSNIKNQIQGQWPENEKVVVEDGDHEFATVVSLGKIQLKYPIN